MIKVFIPVEEEIYNKSGKEICQLSRCFFDDDITELLYDKIVYRDFRLVSSIEEADIILVPYALNSSKSTIKIELLRSLRKKVTNQSVFLYVSGDWNGAYKLKKNEYIIRHGGYRQTPNELTMPVIVKGCGALKEPEALKRVSVGFCGNASTSFRQVLSSLYHLLRINIGRLVNGNLNIERLYVPSYKRYFILESIRKHFALVDDVGCNMILRNGYNAVGIPRNIAKYEYCKNMSDSTHIICIRGTGNFSARFYETLNAGRVPVVIDTDIRLPGHNIIDWSQHILIISDSCPKRIAQEIYEKISSKSLAYWQDMCQRNKILARSMNAEIVFKEIKAEL